VLSHVVAWDDVTATRLLDFARSGGCVVIDATCGRKTLDGTLQRPWPGVLADALGLQAVDLETQPDGYTLSLYGQEAGRWLLARLKAELDPSAGWQAWEELRYADGEPCVWERALGAGRFVVVRGMLGPSQVHARAIEVARYILMRAGAAARHPLRPVGSHWAATIIPVAVEYGTLTVVLAPAAPERGGLPLRLRAPEGHYTDLWTDKGYNSLPGGELALPAEEGIALLWQP
jgi:hypothetical protein